MGQQYQSISGKTHHQHLCRWGPQSIWSMMGTMHNSSRISTLDSASDTSASGRVQLHYFLIEMTKKKVPSGMKAERKWTIVNEQTSRRHFHPTVLYLSGLPLSTPLTSCLSFAPSLLHLFCPPAVWFLSSLSSPCLHPSFLSSVSPAVVTSDLRGSVSEGKMSLNRLFFA